MSIYYHGQKVGCLLFGEGVIDSINEEHIEVKFGHGDESFFANLGDYCLNPYMFLYPLEQYRSIIATLPAPEAEKWQPKKGDWCWFWDNNYQFAVLAQFSSYDAVSSYRYQTNDGTSYQHCAPFIGELPEHLKEVEK